MPDHRVEDGDRQDQQREEKRRAVQKSIHENSAGDLGGYTARFHAHTVAHTNHAATFDHGKNSIARHHTVSNPKVDGTFRMTLLPDLRELKLDFADQKTISDVKFGKINEFGGKIFGEGSGPDGHTFRAHLVHTLHREQTNLAVPLSRVRVALNSPILNQRGAHDIRLGNPPLGADGYSDDAAFRFHDFILPSAIEQLNRHKGILFEQLLLQRKMNQAVGRYQSAEQV